MAGPRTLAYYATLSVRRRSPRFHPAAARLPYVLSTRVMTGRRTHRVAELGLLWDQGTVLAATATALCGRHLRAVRVIKTPPPAHPLCDSCALVAEFGRTAMTPAETLAHLRERAA
ncbi:MAG TPA: hypothetical protein VFM37_01440 [Pseudonocardiaceae bacterium]|nr:hypothetical protein [Pseudonocardiaceae bacterium]